MEKDTKLEIENKSSPYIPRVKLTENCNPETPMVQIDSKKEATSKECLQESVQSSTTTIKSSHS